MGIPLARARGLAPLGVFVVLVFVVALREIRAGVAGRNRPAEEGGGGPHRHYRRAADREETSSHRQIRIEKKWNVFSKL